MSNPFRAATIRRAPLNGVPRPIVHALAICLLVPGGAAPAPQSPPRAPSAGLRFEVASVKRIPGKSELGINSVWNFMPNGDVTISNASLHLIIALAFEVSGKFQDSLLAGSGDLLQQRFELRAKAPPQAQRSDVPAMLRALLEERFALRTHVETRQIPLYELTRVRADRLGPGLQPSDIDCFRLDFSTEPRDPKVRSACPGSRRDSQSMRLRESGPLSQLAWRLQSDLERPVRDATGLQGSYQWDLTFDVVRDPARDSPFPPLETAVQEQLGLRLVPRTGPWEVRVIDSVQAPIEN